MLLSCQASPIAAPVKQYTYALQHLSVPSSFILRSLYSCHQGRFPSCRRTLYRGGGEDRPLACYRKARAERRGGKQRPGPDVDTFFDKPPATE